MCIRDSDKVVDGIDALPDENTQARQYRNGAARPGLQHETGNEHSGRWRIDGSDPSLRQAARAILSACETIKPRVFTQPGSFSDLGPCPGQVRSAPTTDI